MAIVRWDPFRDLMNLQDEVNRLFRRSFFREAETPAGAADSVATWAPAVDIFQADDTLTVEAELPGLEAKEENYHRIERAYGYFERNIPLPCKVKEEKIAAAVSDGVLKIGMPVAEEAKPKQIPIKVEGERE